MDAAARELLAQAVEEAGRLGHDVVDTVHLILAAHRVTSAPIAEAIPFYALTIDQARAVAASDPGIAGWVSAQPLNREAIQCSGHGCVQDVDEVG